MYIDASARRKVSLSLCGHTPPLGTQVSIYIYLSIYLSISIHNSIVVAFLGTKWSSKTTARSARAIPSPPTTPRSVPASISLPTTARSARGSR